MEKKLFLGSDAGGNVLVPSEVPLGLSAFGDGVTAHRCFEVWRNDTEMFIMIYLD